MTAFVKILSLLCFIIGTSTIFANANVEDSKYLIFQDPKTGEIYVEDLTIPRPHLRAIDVSKINFLLFNRKSPRTPVLTVNGANFNVLKNNANFNPNLPLKITIHGWKGGINDIVNTDVTSAVLSRMDANCFTVDWSSIASAFYTTAKSDVPDVGEHVAKFVIFLVQELGVNINNIEIVGHSLGAHVSGFIGKNVQKLAGISLPVIVGLDPAGPLWSASNTASRLASTDADYVQIIHTNDGGLGLDAQIGNADFYPNGGKKQPGCGLDIGGGCSHNRAPAYYAESIKDQGSFESYKANNYDAFKKGTIAALSFMGGLGKDKSSSGKFYLDTKTSSPFSL